MVLLKLQCLSFRFSEIDELALALRRIANNGIEGTLKNYEKELSSCKYQ